MNVEIIKQCWICGKPATSSEHRLKKSDMVREYGAGPYFGGKQPVHFSNSKATKIQGPNSKVIKYPKLLCVHCNTTKSQPFDKAYELFMAWVCRNEKLVLNQRFIDFKTVFGESWEAKQRDLYKYFVKSFGCRLTNASQAVPQDLINLFELCQFKTRLRLTFAVNEDILSLPADTRSGFLGKGILEGRNIDEKSHSSVSFRWTEHSSWLTIFYWYHERPDGSLGSTWVADSQHVYFGSFYPLDNETRQGLVDKLKTD
jgi:hypothetical protein